MIFSHGMILKRLSAADTYATLDPDNKGATISLSGDNMDFQSAYDSNWRVGAATLGFSTGKFYWEFITRDIGQVIFGCAVSTHVDPVEAGDHYLGSTATCWGVMPRAADYRTYTNTGYTQTARVSSTTDVWGIAVDIDAGKMWFAVNNSWIRSGDPANGNNPVWDNLSGTIVPAYSGWNNDDGNIWVDVYFGNPDLHPFNYTPPSGFNAVSINNGASDFYTP